jgi:2,4-dichlorophenol 6-monooxygenase
MSATPVAVDVVIVGAGPTGLTAAHLCHRLGLSAVVLEQREGPQRTPAAHAINARTFEIWRQAGVAMEPVLAAALAPDEAGLVHWVTKFGGEVIGTLPYERQGDEMLTVTPTPLRNLSQHRLEPLLLLPELDVRYRHTWVSAAETATGVEVEAAGPDGPLHFTAKYVLAAVVRDGPHGGRLPPLDGWPARRSVLRPRPGQRRHVHLAWLRP